MVELHKPEEPVGQLGQSDQRMFENLKKFSYVFNHLTSFHDIDSSNNADV